MGLTYFEKIFSDFGLVDDELFHVTGQCVGVDANVLLRQFVTVGAFVVHAHEFEFNVEVAVIIGAFGVARARQ